MTPEEQKQFNDIAKALMTLFIISGAESFHTTQEWKDNPMIGAGEIVELTIIRRHKRIQPPKPRIVVTATPEMVYV